MAVFYDNGGGDIYGGETKEECLEAIKRDNNGDYELSEAFEVEGTKMMTLENEDGSTDKQVSLNEAYTNIGSAYCIASDNC